MLAYSAFPGKASISSRYTSAKQALNGRGGYFSRTSRLLAAKLDDGFYTRGTSGIVLERYRATEKFLMSVDSNVIHN